MLYVSIIVRLQETSFEVNLLLKTVRLQYGVGINIFIGL
jgi:hypothetical protein